MKTYNFVISYDISDDKRLRKAAKILEKEAMRFQYSVYINRFSTKKAFRETY